jgi:hypothetical protein
LVEITLQVRCIKRVVLDDMLLEPINMYNEIRRQEQKEDLIGQSWTPQIENALQRRPFYSRQ